MHSFTSSLSIVLLLSIMVVCRADAQWTPQNPGAGGAFTSIAAGPTGILLAGSDLGGAYMSTDNGASWVCIGSIGSHSGLARSHVRSVAFAPTNPARMFLGTDDGIYRTTDTGVGFTRVLADGYTTAIAVAPSDSNTMYAAQSTSYNDIGTLTIYTSANKGATWSVYSDNEPDSTRILKLVVHPTDATIVYAVTGGDDSGINPFVSTTNKRRFERNPWLYRITNDGSTWTKRGPGGGADSVWDVAIHPINPDVMWATTRKDTAAALDKVGDVWKSTDGGANWTQKFHRTGCIAMRQDTPDTVRVVNVYAGSHSPSNATAGVWETLAGSATWSRRSYPGEGGNPWNPGWQSLEEAYGKSSYGIAPTIGQNMKSTGRDDILWVTAQFAYRSNDGGDTFANAFTNEVSSGPSKWLTRGLENVTVASIYASEGTSGLLFQGYHDLGIWRSINSGASWENVNSSADSLTGSWEGHGGNTTTILGDWAQPSIILF